MAAPVQPGQPLRTWVKTWHCCFRLVSSYNNETKMLVRPCVLDKMCLINPIYLVFQASLKTMKNYLKYNLTQVWREHSLIFWVVLFGQASCSQLANLKMPCGSHISALIPFVPHCVMLVYCTSYNTIYNSSYINVKFGRSHTKA